MSTFSKLLRHVYFFFAAVPCLFSKLLFHIYFFHAAAPWLLFPQCCAMSTFFMQQSHVFFLRHCCAMPTFSKLLHHVYLFHNAALCQLFSSCCTMSTFSRAVSCLLFATLLWRTWKKETLSSSVEKVDMVDSMEKVVIAQQRGISRQSGAACLLFSHC